MRPYRYFLSRALIARLAVLRNVTRNVGTDCYVGMCAHLDIVEIHAELRLRLSN